jgi:thiamine-phosphate pyrophosphorylase
MLRYAITSRASYPGDEPQQQAALLLQASRWTADGIDFIQLREKDLPATNIAALAREILKAIARTTSPTKLLINSRPDIAIATGAHGVHLTSKQDELTPTQVRSLYALTNSPAPIITVSCHSLEDVYHARVNQADAILFAPVFEKIIVGRIITPRASLPHPSRSTRSAALPLKTLPPALTPEPPASQAFASSTTVRKSY